MQSVRIGLTVWRTRKSGPFRPLIRVTKSGACEKFCNPKDLPFGPRLRIRAQRTGGRAVEGTALEMRHTCKGIVGSNPTLSAIKKGSGWGPFFMAEMAEDHKPMFDKIANRRFWACGQSPHDPSEART